MRRAVSVACLIVSLVPAGRARAAGAGGLIEKARAAIARGDVDPARDLGPLVAALRTARGGGREALISAIEDIGQYDGPSPAAVKTYLQREAPPVLIEIAQSKADWTVRGDALMVLRSLNASDEFLDRAYAVAAADTLEGGQVHPIARRVAPGLEAVATPARGDGSHRAAGRPRPGAPCPRFPAAAGEERLPGPARDVGPRGPGGRGGGAARCRPEPGRDRPGRLRAGRGDLARMRHRHWRRRGPPEGDPASHRARRGREGEGRGRQHRPPRRPRSTAPCPSSASSWRRAPPSTPPTNRE